MDVGTLQISKIIVHEVPTRRASGESEPPELSEVESPLDNAVRVFITNKLKGVLGLAFEAVVDGSSESPVPGLVKELLDDAQPDFVSASQSMAEHLYGCQTGSMSEGLLAVVEAKVDGRPCSVILKLEREHGTRFQSEVINGQRTFRLDNIDDLMLTDNTKVFKVALFLRPTDGADIEGYVSDQQRGTRAGRGVADFFLHRFLGCDFKELPLVTTKRAWEVSEAFINEKVTNPEHQTKYELALLAEMSSAGTQFNPVEFANAHLVGADRQQYLNYLEEHAVPKTSFKKDTELIEPYINLMRLESENGVKVFASRKVFQERVKVKQPSADRPETTIEIRDDIKRVGR